MKKQKMLSNSEIASFCKQTAWILKAGITPAEGMEILINDTISKEGKSCCSRSRMICNKGNHFYTALEETGVFPQYVVKLTALGEESGNLDVVLMSLAEYYEREETITDSIPFCGDVSADYDCYDVFCHHYINCKGASDF